MRPQSILNRYLMAFAILDCGKWRKVRDLDPRTLLTLLDFKSSAISQALPTFHINNPIPVYFGEKPSIGKQFELSLFFNTYRPNHFYPAYWSAAWQFDSTRFARNPHYNGYALLYITSEFQFNLYRSDLSVTALRFSVSQ